MNRQVALAELISLLDRLKKPGRVPLGEAHAILHHRQGGELPLGQALGRLIDSKYFRQASLFDFFCRVKYPLIALFADELQRFLKGYFLGEGHIKRDENF
ncbi:MAG: hypothetical protein VYD86_11575, partial [Verrucomicrobiota bacterium]|nr:hypothetical protein [Verrucomicrobiota bacterium]